MSKIKTHKSVSKRVKITKTGKLKKMKAGHGHFNSGEPGKVTRQKRRGSLLSNVHLKNIKNSLPNS